MSRKYPYSPHRRDGNFLGVGGLCKSKTFKEMYEALLEFPERLGGLRKHSFRGGGMDIFWNYTSKKVGKEKFGTPYSNLQEVDSHEGYSKMPIIEVIT